MKKLYLFFTFALYVTFSQAQCFGTFEYPTPATSSHNLGSVQQINTCNFPGDFATLNNLTVGEDYQFTSNVATDFLTLTDTSNNVLASGVTPLVVTDVTVATVRLHIHTGPGCGTASACRVTTLQCTSCTPPTPPVNDDCSAVTATTIVNGAAAVTFTGTTLGATASAEETAILESAMVWEAIELTACSDVTVDYCGTPSGNMDLMMIVYSDCLTEYTIGEYEFETCGDGNGTIKFFGLAPGIYYLPVISDITSNTLGDYIMNVSSIDCPSAPECATAPIFPADGAINIEADTPVTFTWTAPSTGPTPTAYDLYAGVEAGNLQLVDTVTETEYELTIGLFGVFYWQVIPRNGSASAAGCPVWSFTTEAFGGFCVYAPYGQYPSTAYTPSTCDGTTSNQITTLAYAGEYALVNVIAGQTYQFNSSEPDLITISYDGVVADAYGVSSVTWTAPTDGNVRFYAHLNDNNCSSLDDFRTKSVLCGASLGVDFFSVNNLKAYPNPVNNTLYISAQANIQNVSIYNMLGQEVLKTSLNTLEAELNLTALNAGAYFVKVTINDNTGTLKIIKQ